MGYPNRDERKTPGTKEKQENGGWLNDNNIRAAHATNQQEENEEAPASPAEKKNRRNRRHQHIGYRRGKTPTHQTKHTGA